MVIRDARVEAANAAAAAIHEAQDIYAAIKSGKYPIVIEEEKQESSGK